jgi:hypothetical protein
VGRSRRRRNGDGNIHVRTIIPPRYEAAISSVMIEAKRE